MKFATGNIGCALKRLFAQAAWSLKMQSIVRSHIPGVGPGVVLFKPRKVEDSGEKLQNTGATAFSDMDCF
jgi:hypothetical protein